MKLYNIKKNNKNKVNDCKDNNIKIKLNENLIISGIKDVIIKDIIENSVTVEKINNIFKTHFIEHQNKTNRSNPRVSKIPFSKWYVKKYHELYKERIKLCNEELRIIKIINKDDEHIVKIKNEILNLKKEKKEILLKLKETDK